MEEWKNQLPKNQPPPYNREGNNQDSQKPQESPQGSEKRQSGDNVQQFPGVAEGGYPNRIKRPCLQDLTLSVGLVAHPSTSSANMEAPPMMINPGAPAAAAAGHAFLFESNPMTSVPMESPFVVPQAAAVDLRNPTVSYYDRANSMPSTVPVVDEEIHDLLEELTKIHRSSNSEHNLEKILRNKPEDPPALNQLPEDLSLSARPSAHVPHGANPSSSQAPGVSLPVPLSSSGVSYNMASTSNQMASSGSSTAQARNQSQMMLAAAVPPPQVNQWHHANQLKALAANKRGSTTKQQGPPPAWSGLPAPGVSPPFHPVPSPYPLPMFNTQSLSGMSSSNLPATSLQGTPNAVLPGMVTSNSTALVPYVSERLPSPALNQQSPFSPQSSILANLVSSNIRNPPRHRMANMPTSNPRHSYPYRPPRPSSGLPQQSFAPQGSMLRSLPPTGVPLGPQQPLQQQQQSHVVFNKPPANNSSRSLRLVMQQGMASSSSGMPDPFTFGNTRPLSHFASGPRPQRMPSVPTTPRPPSLLQYLQQPMLTQASSASASSTTTATLQSDHSTVFMQQMMQQTQGPAPPLSTDPRQLENPRPGIMPVVPEQQNAYVAQDMSQFQAPQELNPSRCGQPKVIRPSPQPATPSRIELQNILNPGSILPTQPPNQAIMGMVLPNSGQQPPLYTESQRAVPSTSSQHLRNLQAAPPRAPPAGFSAGPLGSQSLSSQQLQRSSLPTSGLRASWEPVLGQADDGSQQQVVSSAAGVLLRAFPTQQAIASPSPMATRVPPSQTATAALASIQSPAQGPGLVLSIPQALQQGLGPFSPVSPAQGIEPPPSYESTMAAAASASTIAASQSPGLPTELASYDPVARPLLNNLSSASEVDVIEALLGSPNASPSKDWMGSQRSVDFLLEQDAAAPQNALNPGDSDDQETGPLPLNRDRPL